MTISYTGGGSTFNTTQNVTTTSDMFSPYQNPEHNRVYFPRTSAKEYNPSALGVSVSPIVFGSNIQVNALVFRLIRNFTTSEGNPNGVHVRAFLYEANPADTTKPLTLITPDVLYAKILPRNVATDGGTANPYYSAYAGQQWAVTLPFSTLTLQAGKHYFVGAGIKEIAGGSQGTLLPQVECHVGTGAYPFADLGVDPSATQYFTTPSSWYLDYPNSLLDAGSYSSTTVGTTLPYVTNAMVGTALKVGVRTYD